MDKDVILTPEGYEKLKQQIEELETTKRREVADRIREAREFGDITENSEYDDAKNEQALLEHRIARLKEQLRAARVIDPKEIGTDVVSVGSKVRLRDVNARTRSGTSHCTPSYFAASAAADRGRGARAPPRQRPGR